MTLTEVLVTCVVVAIVALAVSAVYVATMETWLQTGSKLALQREADILVERMAQEIMSASDVTISHGGTSIQIVRTGTSVGDSTLAAYSLSDDLVLDMHGNTVLDHVESVEFLTGFGRKVTVRVRLEDDMATSELAGDDTSTYIESAAFCRNWNPY